MQTVYLLSDPRTDAPRYVGVTNNLRRRMRDHIYANSHGSHCWNWLNSLFAIGLSPNIKILEVVSDEDRAIAERFWIAYWKERNAELTNLTLGGEGVLGYKPSPEARAKMGVANKGNKYSLGHIPSKEARIEMAAKSWGNKNFLGRKHTLESKRKMSEALKGNKAHLGHHHTAEAKAKMGLANKGNKRWLGRKHTLESRAKMSAARKEWLRRQDALGKTASKKAD